MDIVFTALFIAAAVGIWYFIKKSPSKGKRNLSIVVLIVSALGVSLFSEDDPEENLATASSTQETSEVESTQSSETNEESTEESEEEPTKKRKKVQKSWKKHLKVLKNPANQMNLKKKTIFLESINRL
ncbi:hypothetical protein TMUPMC115_0912 [Tetragenococcus muriaticus PMC-11-5]|uniref:Uncharacterized protein n=1 Tax=Tetragenococcus muriaticus PMC-11-5 TaxID=1302649 RepID=A0A091C6Y3_9ENTE|nr:hypothetical protein [Tetragenococcus muriaticus]KFN92400.1 hypothetical protein TMUPMC115_0912 [Tetragenococcus muriaticus PMC-11-5]